MGMPRFDGSGDAYWWLIQTRKYLESTWLPEESWLSFVDLGLDGEARDWFVSWRKVNQNVEFLQFVGDLLIKFKPEFGRYFQDVEEETVAPTETAMNSESRTTLEQQLKDEEPVLEKERVPLAQESKREGILINKQQTEASPKKSNKPEVKTKPCRAQIWSKQNIWLALKMRGITIKWKKRRARTDSRIIVKEGIQANLIRETSNQAIPLPRRKADRYKKRKQQVQHQLRTRRVICRPPPKPPDHTIQGLNFLSPINAQPLFISVWDGNASLAMSFYSSYLIIPWDPRKPTTVMPEIACEYCWANFSSIYGLLHFVYDRGKIWEEQIDVRNKQSGGNSHSY